MLTPQIEKKIVEILKKAYGPQKMSKYSKKVKQIRKKKGGKKKKALHSQFKYVDKLVQHSMKKLGKQSKARYTPSRVNNLRRMRPQNVNRIYNRTRQNPNPYEHVSDMYQAMQALDYIEKQREALAQYE